MIKTRFYDDLGVVVHIAVGPVSVKDIMGTATAWFDNAHYGPEVPVVWDLVEADLNLSLTDANLVDQSHIDKVNAFRPSGRTAWVFRYDIDQMLVSALQESQGWATEWRSFKDPDEAVAWATGSH